MRQHRFVPATRRAVLAGIAAASLPWAARAQGAKPPARTGVLTLFPATSPRFGGFRQGLRDLGYVEGQNLVIDYRDATPYTDRLAGVAAELVALKVDAIFAIGSEATSAAQHATTTIPIVMTSSNPVALGFIASLARPGGNITGISLLLPEVSGKRLEMLKELVPGMTKVAAFWNPDDPGAALSVTETKSAAEKLALQLQLLETRRPGDFAAAFQAASDGGAQAVVALPAPLMIVNAAEIAALALQHRLPIVSNAAELTRAGGPASYGTRLIAADRRAAYFVDRLLKGAKPADLPVEQPTKFDLLINLKTAQALGIAVSPTLLATADEVIE